MSDKHNDSRSTTTNQKSHSIQTSSLEASSNASSTPIKIPSRSSGNAHNNRIPSPSTETQIQQAVRKMPSSTFIQNTESSYSPKNNQAEVESSASPKSKSFPKKVYNYLRGHLSSSTGAPDVPKFSSSPSPSNSEPTCAQSRTSYSSASTPPGSARKQNEDNRNSLEFNANSQYQKGENEIILEEIDLSPPENKPLESLIKRFEDASIQVDRPYKEKSNSQNSDEDSRTSNDMSNGAQSRLSGQTANAPFESELHICSQNEVKSLSSSLIPGHADHRVDQDVVIGSQEGQRIFPRMKHRHISHS